MQLLDSDCPTNILAGSNFRAQKTRALSPDGVCALARARMGTRLRSGMLSIVELYRIAKNWCNQSERSTFNQRIFVYVT